METWTNKAKSGVSNNLTWAQATFQWNQAGDDTWNNSSFPFITQNKSAVASWANKTKDVSVFTNKTKD